MSKETYWAVVPAAGVGKRMGASIPKQYLSLCGEAVIAHTLRKLAAIDEIEGIVLSLASDDGWWPELDLDLAKPLVVVEGGEERVHSVYNAVSYFERNETAIPNWFLVHDAARPCVRLDDIRKLIDTVQAHPCGGILAARVRDTMKRSSGNGGITETVNRSNLWHALTPQLFRSEILREALKAAMDYPKAITDEASAVETLGLSPQLVEGHMDNIKITQPEDLRLAEFFLQQEGSDNAY